MSRALEVRRLFKTYQVFRRGSGLGEALVSLFRRKFTQVEAVRDVNLELGRRARRVLGPERRRKIDHPKDAIGHPAPNQW